MADPRYEYQKANAVKILLRNKEGQVLLIREPLTHEWMPGHWGLPGGKALVRESLLETFERKMRDDLGSKTEIEGIFKIVELLMPERTVLMYVLVASTNEEKFSGEFMECKWVGRSEVEGMEIKEFTEYYNREMLLEFFDLGDNLKLEPVEVLKTYKYYAMDDNEEYKKWLDSGKGGIKK